MTQAFKRRPIGTTYHLSVDWTSDFDSSVLESRSGDGALPGVILTDGSGLWVEVGEGSTIVACGI